MFWTTYASSGIRPERTILMPCLHDEPPARLDVFASMMAGVHGVWFLTGPEQDLARRLYRLPSRHEVVGAMVTVPERHDADGFRERHGIDGPYVYYAGRREWGKGWDDLLVGFAHYRNRRRGRAALKLVTSGVGNVELPPELADDLAGEVVDVGLLSDADRDGAMAGAEAYVQPSAWESFSRTVLESMAASTPVIANRAGAVVRWHLERSGAGLVYRGRDELAAALDFVTDEPVAAAALAVDGPAYVARHYHKERVLDALTETLDRWLPAADTGPALSAVPAPDQEVVR
jgi:glycosyltransferase involved in cell wall biosynthesis